MTQPSTGTDWDGTGANDLDAQFLERGKPIQIFCRDARGSATDMSPHNSDGSQRFSPFALDGKPRADLALQRKVNGYWVSNPVTPNLGFHIAGAFKEGDGPGSNPNIKSDKFMIEQSDFPFDSDLVEQGENFSFIPVETGKPAVRRLRNNLPFSSPTGDPLVEDPGFLNAGWARPLDSENIGRQFLVARKVVKNGQPIYKFEGYNLAKLENIGKSKHGKKDSEASEFSYEPIPDGFFMAMQDGVYRPILKYTWVGGPGWTALGGVPVVSATLATATPGGSGAVTVAFPEPTGTGDPWAYKAQASSDSGVTWGTAITPANVAVASGVVTLTLAGVATGSKKFRGMVTGTNGAVAYTPASTAITVT